MLLCPILATSPPFGINGLITQRFSGAGLRNKGQFGPISQRGNLQVSRLSQAYADRMSLLEK